LNGNKPVLEDTFCVIVPTYNREELLPRALDSLLGQTYGKWLCWIIDDGSTDNTDEVVRNYIHLDERFNSIELPENRGGVAANEIGMRIACTRTSWWTRLGSDDTFLPHKLELDAQALRFHDATFGPFMTESLEGEPEAKRNLPITAAQARCLLETPGGFAASWANVAARTTALHDIEKFFGSYVDSRLRNMEDLLFNFRLSRITDWVWRGRIKNELVIGPSEEVCKAHEAGVEVEHDATWTRNPIGASASTEQTRHDGELSYGIIAAERHAILWPPEKQNAENGVATSDCPHDTSDAASGSLSEVEARRLIGKLLWTKATCNWNIAEHGDRLGKIWEIGKTTASLEGCVAELGVARGGTTQLLSAMFPQKTIYAIDGFEGLIDSDPEFDILPPRTFTEIDVEATRQALQDCQNVVLYHGRFPAVIDSRLSNENFNLVHLDTDTYFSIYAGLEFFVPRLVQGGMIFVDDYGWDRAPGVQKAVDELLPKWPALSLSRTTPVQAVLQFKS
jgi:glycosyltransferase involved in cell wall biosynthesis